MRLTTDSVLPVLQLLRECRLSLDPRFLGELKPFYENAGLRAHYFDKQHGATIDEFGELLLDRGYVTERPREEEILSLLDQLFTGISKQAPVRLQETEENANAREIERELERARKNRYRAWNCACGESKLRSGRLTLRLTCGHCNGAVNRLDRTIAEIVLGISLSEINRPDYQPNVAEESVPF